MKTTDLVYNTSETKCKPRKFFRLARKCRSFEDITSYSSADMSDLIRYERGFKVLYVCKSSNKERSRLIVQGFRTKQKYILCIRSSVYMFECLVYFYAIDLGSYIKLEDEMYNLYTLEELNDILDEATVYGANIIMEDGKIYVKNDF